MIEVTLPLRIQSTMNFREHWAAKAKRAKLHRTTAFTVLRAEALFKGTTGPVTVTITRIAPRLLDDDNAIAGCKNVRDGIADWLGRDDGDPLVSWRYCQEKGKEYAVRVRVEA